MGKMRTQQQHAQKAVCPVPTIKLKQGRPVDWANLEIRSINNGWDKDALQDFVVRVLKVMPHRWYISYTEFGFKLYEKTEKGDYKLVTISKIVDMYKIYLVEGRTSVI